MNASSHKPPVTELLGPKGGAPIVGLTAYTAPGQGDVQDLAPWVAHVLECFTPDRIVWGSDWPVANLGVGLPTWIDQTVALLSHLSEYETAAITQANARRIYDL